MNQDLPPKVAIIGSGLIGRSWAMLFASAGCHVQLYDVQKEFLEKALEDIERQLQMLESSGILRGSLTPKQQLQLISITSSLAECLQDAGYIQECIPENLDLKRKVFAEIDTHIKDSNTIVASSTSAILPSSLSDHLVHKEQVLVAHPVNPPYHILLVELVPAPWTRPDIVSRTREIMTKIGQKPVTLSKPVPGFALNRIQHAIVTECWRLVSDGTLSVADVDTVMIDGLAPRYAFIGALETLHLNAAGLLDYCKRYGQAYLALASTSGPVSGLEGQVAENIYKQLCEKVPLSQLEERRAWRDERLAALALLKKKMDQN